MPVFRATDTPLFLRKEIRRMCVSGCVAIYCLMVGIVLSVEQSSIQIISMSGNVCRVNDSRHLVTYFSTLKHGMITDIFCIKPP